jgi:type II secretory pathway predicted ATPase ExeA
MMPYIEGSTKVDLGKWFDFVLYTKVRKSKKGEREYLWVTARDEHYCHAKDRSQMLDPEMPQDYQLILNAIKKIGWKTAKILIIGEPGSGKTLSCKTLINNKQGE